MRFQAEPFERWHKEAEPLFFAHWRLVGRHKERFPLAPDYGKWIEAERKGLVWAATARLGWLLAGYAIFMVARHWDYPTMFEAKQRAIFIDPRHLRGRDVLRFRRFLEFCDGELGARGVNKVIHHMKLEHDFSGTLRKLGYEESERSFERLL